MSGELARAGTIVIRDGLVAYASEAAAAILRRPLREIVGRPALLLVVPEEHPRLEELRARSLSGEPIPQALELVLALPDGDRRLVECFAETDGADVIVHVRDLGAQAARRRRLDAIATAGAAIRSERSEEAVHARVRSELEKLGLASALTRSDPGGSRILWLSVPEPLRAEFQARLGVAPEGYLGLTTEFAATLSDQGVAFTDDWAADVAGFLPPEHRELARALVSRAGLTRAIAVRLDDAAHPLASLLVAGSWLRSDDVPAMRLFAAQVSAALEAAHIIADLSRRNAHLAVLNRVAELAGEATDLASFFARAAEVVRPTAGFTELAIFVHDEPSGSLLRLHAEGASASLQERSVRLSGARHLADAMRDRTARVLSARYSDLDPEPLPLAGPAALAYVPLVARSRSVGVLVAGFEHVQDARGVLDLLSAVGAHFASAIESHGLLSDLRRRVSDLEAVQALALGVFESAPGDVRALLTDGCSRIARALAAPAAAVLLATDGGITLRVTASVGLPRLPEGLTIEIAADPLSAEVLRRRGPVVGGDLGAARRSPPDVGADVAPTATLAVPLEARGAVRGVLYVCDAPDRTFSASEVALASALAGALGVGVENAELYADARRRLEEVSLLNEVGRSLVETLDIEQVLGGGVRNLARIVAAPAAYLALLAPDGEHLEVRAVAGAPRELVGHRIPLSSSDACLATLVFDRREPILVEDATTDPRIRRECAPLPEARAYLGLPLVVREQTIGSAVIVETRGPRLFTPPEVERGAAISNQLAVAADNARLYEDLRRSYAQLARAQEQLIQGERLAALGELSAIVAHEVRNPLGVIFNSLGSLRRLVRPTGDAKMLFDIVGEESERLNRIVGDLLDFARPSAPQLRPEPLGRVVEDAVAAAIAQNAGPVELAREVDPSLPPVVIDARLVRQAVVNVAVNAMQAMPRGGRITIRTRLDGDDALVEIEDTGAGIPDEVRARIFEPFFTTKASGTGLGLAVVKRIVEGHGGRVSVRSGATSGTVFALRFPLAGTAVENGPAIG